jgi:hypothetical protein
MPDIMIKCPVLGRFVSTGLRTYMSERGRCAALVAVETVTKTINAHQG